MSAARVLGQEVALGRLARMISGARVPAALLFQGPDGVGKRLSARLFAAALNCEQNSKLQAPTSEVLPFCGECDSCRLVLKGSHPDVAEVDDAFQAALLDEEVEKQKSVRVATARELSRRAALKGTRGGWKVFIVDNAHLLEPEAGNALLKALEEPAPDTLWILVSSRRESVLATVRSRCQEVSFRALSAEVLLEVLLREKLLEEAAARRWAEAAEGSISLALALARSEAFVEGARGAAAYWEVSQSLPRELARARETVDAALAVLLAGTRGGLRRRGGDSIRAAELLRLRRALRANVSPHLVLQLALLKSETPAS